MGRFVPVVDEVKTGGRFVPIDEERDFKISQVEEKSEQTAETLCGYGCNTGSHKAPPGDEEQVQSDIQDDIHGAQPHVDFLPVDGRDVSRNQLTDKDYAGGEDQYLKGPDRGHVLLTVDKQENFFG